MILIVVLIGMALCSESRAGEFSIDKQLSVGYKDMLGGHSESQSSGDPASTRCMNGGFGVDLEYRLPLSYDLNKWLGVSLVPGAMLTYSNFDTASRKTSTSPESKQRRESSIRETMTLRPTLRIWKVRLFKVYGFGLDYNQPTRSFGLGYIRPDDSRGVGVDFTENFSVNAEEYKFVRYDGTTYRYQTVNLNWTF